MRRIAARSSNGFMRSTLVSAFRGKSAFLLAALRTMSSAGDFHAPVRPLRYPRDAGHRDLTRIGQDMYRAMERHAVETSDA